MPILSLFQQAHLRGLIFLPACSNAAGAQQGSCEVLQTAAFFACVYILHLLHLLNSVFYSTQTQGISAAPLMKAFVVGSETKMETFIGRRRPIRQVIEEQTSFCFI